MFKINAHHWEKKIQLNLIEVQQKIEKYVKQVLKINAIRQNREQMHKMLIKLSEGVQLF